MKLTEDFRATIRTAKCWLALVLLMSCALLMTFVVRAQSVSTTTVQGTVYLANGRPGAGTLAVRWPAFTTTSGQAVVAGSLTVKISSDGFVSVSLAPNQGSTPAGEYYTAVFYMSDGTTSTEYRWRDAAELLGVFGSGVCESAIQWPLMGEDGVLAMLLGRSGECE